MSTWLEQERLGGAKSSVATDPDEMDVAFELHLRSPPWIAPIPAS